MKKLMLAIPLLVGACATASTIQVAQDSILIRVAAEAACQPHTAIQFAQQQAAIETIKAGFDRYIVVSGNSSSGVIGNQPESQGQTLTIKMFHEGDKGSENALSARQILGPDWQDKIKSKPILVC